MKEKLLKIIDEYFDETGYRNEKGQRVVEADLLKFRNWLATQEETNQTKQ